MLGVSIFIFIIMDFFPGDAADTVLGEGATQEQLEEYRNTHGLNDPVLVRYARYMLHLIKGDMGISYVTGRDVFKTYMQRLPNTMLLAFTGMALAILFSIPMGIIAALRRSTILDGTLMILALLGLSMPLFWLGLLLIIGFSLHLGWFPTGGAGSLKHLVLPAVTLAVAKMAMLARTTRSSMLSVLNEDYIRTARAKGVSKRSATLKHALRNAHTDHYGHRHRTGVLIGGIGSCRNCIFMAGGWSLDHGQHQQKGYPDGDRLPYPYHHDSRVPPVDRRHHICIRGSKDQGTTSEEN